MAFCNKCGTALPDGANVCPKCGNPVNNTSAPKAAPAKNSLQKFLSSKKWNTVATIFIFVAYGFAAIAILYGFIDGIVSAAGEFGTFRSFVVDFFNGFRRALNYVFYALIVSFLQKKFSK